MTANRNKSRESLVWLCKTAVFAALLMMLQMTGLGMIKTPWGLSFTLYGMVVVVGTLAIDLKAGLILSAVFGGISAWQNATALDMVATNPLFPLRTWSVTAVVVLCILPRLLIPVVTCGVRWLLKRTRLNEHVSLALNGCIGSLTNTVFFLGLMLILYMVMGTLPDWVVAYAGTAVSVNGVAEAVLTTIATPAVVLALSKLK